MQTFLVIAQKIVKIFFRMPATSVFIGICGP